MKFKNVIKSILLSLLIIFFSITPAIADVGSFDSYDSGDSSWGSSYDYGDSYSDDWGYYDGGSYGGFYYSPMGFGELAFFIILLIIVVIANKNKGKNKNDGFINTSVYTTSIHDVPRTHVYADKIKLIDPLFSEEDFLAWTKDLYIKMQHAWTDRNWEEMRVFETEKLFEQHSAQLQEYIRNDTINVVERIAVNYATIYNFSQTENKDIIDVALKATKKDYIISAKTGKVVEGNENQYRITVYKMTFERTKGILTQEANSKLDAKNCPNCGAPLKITSAGKCEYCGSIVSAGIHDWVLSNIEPLKN